jgi:hypothetical protein
MVEERTFRDLGKADNEILLSLYRLGSVYSPINY